MRRALIAIALIACSSAANADACRGEQSAILGGGYVDGNDLRQFSEPWLGLYAMGYMDALLGGTLYGMKDACRAAIDSCNKGRKSDQLAAIARKFLKENPERWHEPANLLLYEALLRRCLYPEAK